jgi:hypothetical protein
MHRKELQEQQNSQTPTIMQKTSRPSNDNQHYEKKKKAKTCPPTMMINIVEESNNQKHVAIVDNKNREGRE